MKQAILITAYKNFDHLIDVINFFDRSFGIYIHFDKKQLPSNDMLKDIESMENVKFVSKKHKVLWGGINHMKAYMLLAKEALKDKENNYFHLISGQDYPIKSKADFSTLMQSDVMHDYLHHFELPFEHWPNGGMDRIEYYNFFDKINGRKKPKLIEKLVMIQKFLGIKRPTSKLPKLFGGSTYWSLTRATLQYVLQYTENNDYLIKRLKHTFCAEEIYFQTVIMNSEYSQNVVNDNLRYIDWTSDRPGGRPALLNLSDYDALMESHHLFARKFDPTTSEGLKKLIQQKLTLTQLENGQSMDPFENNYVTTMNTNKIPKIVHYCWFGNSPIPSKFKEFIAGWKALNPSFELIKWDETNSPVHIPYLQQALRHEKWSNASNFVRLWAIYHHGGIYMDTDVRLVKPLDELLANEVFFGFQTERVEDINCINNAFFGAVKKQSFVKLCQNTLLGLYDGLETAYLSSPHLTSFLIKQHGDFDYGTTEVNEIKLYSRDYLYPYSWEEEYSEACITKNTIGIHYWDASWSR